MTTAAPAKLARLEPLEPEPAAANNLAQQHHQQSQPHHHHHLHHQKPLQQADEASHASQVAATRGSPAPVHLNQATEMPVVGRAKSAATLPIQQTMAPQHNRNSISSPATNNCHQHLHQQHQSASQATTNTAPVAKKRGRRRQQSQPEQANGLDHVFLWDIDGSLVRSGTIVDSGEPVEPSVLASVNDKLNELAKRLKELALNFCDQHLFLSELESVDQMHIDDVPSGEQPHHHHQTNNNPTSTTPTNNHQLTPTTPNNHQPAIQVNAAMVGSCPPEAALSPSQEVEPLTVALAAQNNQDMKPVQQNFHNNKLVLAPLVQQTCDHNNNNNIQLYNSTNLAEELEQRYDPVEPIYGHHQLQHHRPPSDQQLEYSTQEQLYAMAADTNHQQQHHHNNTPHIHLHQANQQQAACLDQADLQSNTPHLSSYHRQHNHSHSHEHQQHQHHHHHHHHLTNHQPSSTQQQQQIQQSPPNNSSLHNYLQQQHRHFHHSTTNLDPLHQPQPQPQPQSQQLQPQFQSHYDNNFSTTPGPPQIFQQVSGAVAADTPGTELTTGANHYYQSTGSDCERAYLLEPLGDSQYYTHHPYHNHNHHHHHHHLPHSHQHLSHHNHHQHQHHSGEQVNSSSYMSHESSATSESGYPTSESTTVAAVSTGCYEHGDDHNFSQLAILQGVQAYTPTPAPAHGPGLSEQVWLGNHDTGCPQNTHLHSFQVNQAHHNANHHHRPSTYSSASLIDSSEHHQHQFQHSQFHYPTHHQPHQQHQPPHQHHNHHQHHLHHHHPQQDLLHTTLVQHHDSLTQQPLLTSACSPLRAEVDEHKAPLIEPVGCQLEAELDQHSTLHLNHQQQRASNCLEHLQEHQHHNLHLHHHHHHQHPQKLHQHHQPQPQRQPIMNSNSNNNNNTGDCDQQITPHRTVLSNQHKQITHKLSMRFQRIKTVYNLNRNTSTGGLFKGNEQMAQDLGEILTEIDHYTLDWRKRAMDCLRLIAESPNCTNIIITKLPLIVAFGHLVCLDLAQFFDIDQVYSACKTSKEACIARIKKRFGATNRCSYIIVGPKDKENVDVSERLDLPVWPTTRSDGHRQLTNLMRALREGLLM